MTVVFNLSALWWKRIKGLWKLPDGRDWLRGKLGLVLMGRGMLSKSLIQFSVDGQGCVPSLFTWGQTVVEVMKIMLTSFKRSHSCTATFSNPNPEAGHSWPTPLLKIPGHSQASLGQSLLGSLLLSPGCWCTRLSLCPPSVCFPVLCKFWRLYGGVHGDLLQERLCHTQVCCTQSPWQSTSDPYLHRRCSGSSVSVSVGSLCTRFVWAPLRSLTGMEFDSKSEFAPSC